MPLLLDVHLASIGCAGSNASSIDIASYAESADEPGLYHQASIATNAGARNAFVVRQGKYEIAMSLGLHVKFRCSFTLHGRSHRYNGDE